MATLSIDLDEVRASVGMIIGLGRDYDSWDSVTQADVDRIVRSGRRSFYTAHNWQHLHEHIQILTAEPFTDGTIEIVAGIVTLTGGTWPTGAAYAVLVPDDSTYGDAYEVASRDDNTQLTLINTEVAVDALTTYTVYQFRYPLASNFGGFIDPIIIENQPQGEIREYAVLPDWTLQGVANIQQLRTGRPELFAVTQIPDSETGIPSYFLDVYPLPDAVYILKSRMSIDPGDSLAEASSICHPAFSETMMAAILSSAEMLLGERGVWTERFEQLLPQAIERDRRMRGTRRLKPREIKPTLPANYQAMIAPLEYET